ncbi:hypothetical protein CVT25_003116 [Psilocybe cyanescens]|uniref:F-box domain-containing protein n=1 Tax=Psilocybe cyanescens TaxID=93625 RepID=A0A409XQV0_PSICY|nr:hypothetical protein CVT25_003116 [Psilocybe cyanescens]
MTEFMRTPINIPQELCGIICQDPVLENQDLHNLCAVSRNFRAEAERLLCTSVRLRDTHRIKVFCIAVARRPYLALRTKSLTLRLPPQLNLEADDLSRIVIALRLSVNLKELNVLQDFYHGPPGKHGDAVQWWILDGHQFRLKKFTNSYFQPQMLVGFLKSQPGITTLIMKCKDQAEICDAPLPLLSTLDCSAAVVQEFSMPSWHPRNIKRLQFHLEQSTDVEELSTFVALTQFNTSLKSLSIKRKNSRHGLDIAVLTACVASQLPDIKYLRIVDNSTRLETYHVPFLPFPIRLNKIETLILRPPTRACDNTDRDSRISTYIELRTPEGRRNAAGRIMETLPTLKRLVLVEKSVHEFTRDLDTNAITTQELTRLEEDDWMQVR